MAKLVFFDLDGTLFSYNSAYGWMKREFREGHITLWQAIRGWWWLLLYSIGVAKMDDAIRKAALVGRGQKETDMKERVRRFWEEEVRHKLRSHAVECIETHRAAGHHLAILTSSSNYLSAYAAAHWKIPHVLANHFVVVDDVFTGEMVEPICFGEGKLTHARALAEQLGVALEDCIFYTDSYSDYPAMVAMGRPIAVHPDRRLARAARKHDWDIEYWA